MGPALRVAVRHWAGSVVLPVPIIQQSSNFSCGSACLLACLHYWNGEYIGIAHEIDLWNPLGIDPEVGVEPEQMVTVATNFGLEAQHVVNMTVEDLRSCCQRGDTVIVLLQAWQKHPAPWATSWDDGHYVVAVGADVDKMYFMDPSVHMSYGWIPLADLGDRWHNPSKDGAHQYGEAVIIRGTTPMPVYPAPPIPML